MSSTNHSLQRRVAPAIVLTGASVLGIFLLDHASSRGGRFGSASGGLTNASSGTTLPTPTTPGATPGTIPGPAQPGSAGADAGGINPNAAQPGATTAAPRCTGTTTTGQPADITDFRRTFGTVTVSIVKDKSGTVCDVTATWDVQDRRSTMIENYSIPRLYASAVASGATSLQAISGATAICDAYAQSLQSALDAAK